MIPAFTRKVKQLLTPASQTAAATRSALLDVLGADYAEIMVNYAAEVNTSAVGPAVVISEGDTTNGAFATWSSSCTVSEEDLTAAHITSFKFQTGARKRYIKILQTAATHTTNDIVTSSVVGITDRQEQVAAGTAAMGVSTNDRVVVL